jgi:hypothetical protein
MYIFETMQTMIVWYGTGTQYLLPISEPNTANVDPP